MKPHLFIILSVAIVSPASSFAQSPFRIPSYQPATPMPTGYIYDPVLKKYIPLYNGAQPKLKPEFANMWMWVKFQPAKNQPKPPNYTGQRISVAIEKPAASNTGPTDDPEELPPIIPKLGKPTGVSVVIPPSVDPADVIVSRVDRKPKEITRNEADDAYRANVRVSIIIPGNKKPIIKAIDIEIPDEDVNEAIKNKKKGDTRSNDEIIADFITQSIREAALEKVGITTNDGEVDHFRTGETPSPFAPSEPPKPAKVRVNEPAEVSNPKDEVRRRKIERALEEVRAKNAAAEERERDVEKRLRAIENGK